MRYHHWYEIFCQLAPQSCELIKGRPEINECKFMNVNYVAGKEKWALILYMNSYIVSFHIIMYRAIT